MTSFSIGINNRTIGTKDHRFDESYPFVYIGHVWRAKLDYCDTVYYPLQEFQLKRIQRVQLVAASFVLSR